MRWKISSAKTTGNRHNLNEDSIRQTPYDDFLCVVGADGAGIAKCARIGADFTTQTVRELLIKHKDGIFNYTDDEIKCILLDNLNDKLSALAKKEGNNIDDYMSTLMFFISNGEKYIIGNLGDGLLGSMDSEGKSEVLSLPEHGKYANQSFFVTHKNSKDHLRIHKGRYESHKVYFMMTDGSAECLYNFNLKSFANILKVFCEWIIKYEPHKVSDYIQIAMIKLFGSKTSDDCSLALIYGVEDRK